MHLLWEYYNLLISLPVKQHPTVIICSSLIYDYREWSFLHHSFHFRWDKLMMWRGSVPNKGQGVPAALQHFILILFVTHLSETLCYLQFEYSLRNIVNYIMFPLIV